MKILFVCSQNMCRSPYCEYMFRKMVQSSPSLRDKVEVTRSSAVMTPGTSIDPLTVEALVREGGLTAVTPPRFLPARLRGLAKGTLTQIKDGAGVWIVTDRFSSPALRRLIRPFCGRQGTVRLPFADREILLNIAPDGETFRADEKQSC